MNQYLQQLNNLAAQNEEDSPSDGGPFDTNPISGQIASQQQVGQPQMGGGYDVDVSGLVSSGLPQLMSQDRAAIDPSLAVQMGAAQQAGASAVTPQGTATPTTGAAPGQEEPQRERRRGGGATWEAPGEAMELSQEDFYTTPGPLEGNYDTGNEYVARSARMPMGALSKAAATLQNRQLELDQKRQAFQEELYKPVKTAAPYQQNFNAIVNKQREDFIQKVAQDLTGGNVNKAYREIFSNPRLRAQYRELNADLEALGQRGAATFEKVIDYQNKAATNKIQSTPEQRKLANDIAMGLGGYSAADGTGGSFDKLIKDMNRWDQMEGRDQYFKNTVGPSIKDFFQRIPKEIGWEIKNGRYRLLTEESVKSWDSHIRQLAVDMAVWQGYGDGDLPDEKIQDNINYLTNMLGQQVDREIKVIDTYSNISRGDGGGGQNGPQYSYTAAVRPNPLDPRLGGNDELYFTPSETVGNRQQAVAVSPVRVTYVDPNKPPQTRVLGYPELKFDEVGQDWVITGNDLGNTAETNVTITTPVTIEDAYAQAEQVKKMIAKSNKRTEAFASENPDFLRNKYGTTDVYQILSNQLGGAISAEDLRKNWGDYYYRKDVKNMLRTRTAPGASTPAPTPYQSTAGTSGASQGTQQSNNTWY
jgi:hypothetical protein